MVGFHPPEAEWVLLRGLLSATCSSPPVCSQAQKRCYHKEMGIQALPGKPSPLPTIFLWLGINLPATQRCSQGWFRTAGLQVWRRNAIVSTFSSLCHTQRLRSSFYFPLVPFSSPITFLTAMTSFNDNLAQARVISEEGSSTEKMSPQEGAAGKPASVFLTGVCGEESSPLWMVTSLGWWSCTL